MNIRQLLPQDRPFIAELLAKIPSFDQADRNIALELIDTSLNQADQVDYLFIVSVNSDDRPTGYACYGPTPLTKGTYTLYWIAVDPAYAGKGIGTQLLKIVEQNVHDQHGRMLVLETSSARDYASTRHFYAKNGYTLVETLRDFYRPGEHRLTYLKRV